MSSPIRFSKENKRPTHTFRLKADRRTVPKILQDLIELVQEQLPDDCGCIDIEDQEIIYTLTDDQVRDLLLQLSHTPTIAQFQQLPLAQQTHYILQASRQGEEGL